MPFLPTFHEEDDRFDVEPAHGATLNEAKTPDQRVRVAVRALKQMRQQLDNVLDLLERGEAGVDASAFRTDAVGRNDGDAGRVVEGVFDGERMMGTDGIKYNVPPNYASKSKLVEGDVMKLVIKDDGTFIYKQIGPVERQRVVGKLATDDYGNYALLAEDGTSYRILTASVTYYKGEPGDEVVGLIPKDQKVVWAAVENIIKK